MKQKIADWIYTHVFALIGTAISLAAFALAYYQWQEKRLAEEQTKVLRMERDQLAASNHAISVLDIISRYASALPGTGERGDPASGPANPTATVRRETTTNILKSEGRNIAPQWQLELNMPGLNALRAVTETLLKQNDDAKSRAKFMRSFIAPILFAKSQSDDPTEAAAALYLCGEFAISNPEFFKRDSQAEDDTSFRLQVDQAFKAGSYRNIIFRSITPRLDGFNLERASFANANFMQGASFTGAALRGTDFNSAVFQGEVSFARARVIGTTQETNGRIGVDIQSLPLTFKGARFGQQVDFKGADLSGAIFDGAVFDGTNIVGAKFVAKSEKSSYGRHEAPTAASLGNAQFDKVKFAGCVLDGVSFANALVRGCSFENDSEGRVCSLKGAVFGKNCDAVFRDCDLTGADLGQVALSRESFKNILVDWARLPVSAVKSALKEGDELQSMIRLSPDAVAILVQAIEAPAAQGPKWMYAGYIGADVGGYLPRVPGDSTEVLRKMERLSVEQLGALGIDIREMEGKLLTGEQKREAIKRALATSPMWAIQL